MENRKFLMDRFQEHVQSSYQTYCNRHGMPPSVPGLITFLIDQELIPPTNIKRFTVVEEFDRLHPEQERQKTRTVNALADRFNISERAVWGILKNARGPEKPKE
jgi:hypothetical protein